MLDSTPSSEINRRNSISFPHTGAAGKDGKAALSIAKAIHYSGVGTVEFIVNHSSNQEPEEVPFYFLEMNTRLQVEHGITEMVTGLDLVSLQIQIAEGAPLTLQQHEIKPQGYAIECRLYAEDPQSDFHPITGQLLQWQAARGPNIRIDSGVQTNSKIPIFYDPLLAKIMTWGASRGEALRLMHYALRETYALGITTNHGFLRQVLQLPAFVEGRIDTNFVEQHFSSLQHCFAEPIAQVKPEPEEKLIQTLLTASVIWFHLKKSDFGRPAEAIKNWQGGFHVLHTEKLRVCNQLYEISYYMRGNLEFELQIAGQVIQATVRPCPDASKDTATGSLKIRIEDVLQTFHLAEVEEKLHIYSGSLGCHCITRQTESLLRPVFQEINPYQTKLPARIVAILVAPGQKVMAGEPLIMLESMKMETSISARESGFIQQIFVRKDQLVEAGTHLLSMV